VGALHEQVPAQCPKVDGSVELDSDGQQAALPNSMALMRKLLEDAQVYNISFYFSHEFL
jgi:hypothetical protein